ncbi:hypothetical protein Pyrfu_1137 [Pyrolobus fumarii 1A]|uniref:DUF1640 domain-containing protein n=1 Tax=Pyrolobus fumarii (strain DSM 11204 / 1A) TaxID=694429 RepID=G0EFH8_PYRF1|nr:hypothetical protein [Pyrolobus fumarii]AEM39002.1 hypothetical protein Pyrfu_1137 [Pyrolobus fumarii 1A]
MSPIVDRLVEELRANPEKRAKLARLLALDIAAEESLRTLLLEALLREAVTKRDLKELEDRMEKRLDGIERRIDSVERRIKKLEEKISSVEERIVSIFKWMIGLLVTIWLTLLALLLPVIIKLGLAG